MRIELYGSSEGKLEDVLEQLYTRYDLEDLTPEELIDALLDIAVDLVIPEEVTNTASRDRLITLCGQKVTARG